MTILMTPDMSNFAGNVHGGLLLNYLDQVAYTCATRYARNYAVTLSVDQVVFREPIHIGELVTLQASVNWTGRTSGTLTAATSRWSLWGPTGGPSRYHPGTPERPRSADGTPPPPGVGNYAGRSLA
jgi:hypothetical protein